MLNCDEEVRSMPACELPATSDRPYGLAAATGGTDRVGTEAESRPLVSAIICTHPSARFVAQAVESALAQTYPRVEVLVVDDGSTDATARVLAPYGARVRYLPQRNRGTPAARNAGIRSARGSVLAFLDADDWWRPEKLEKAVALLANPRVALVHSNLVYLREETGEHVPNPRPRQDYAGKCYGPLFHSNGINLSSAVVRRTFVEKVGLFDESLSLCEDYDLWLRLARWYEFAYVPELLTVSRLPPWNSSPRALGMARWCLAVLEKALFADPCLWALVGERAVRERLFGLYFDCGYLAFNNEGLGEARSCFWRALRWRPSNGYTALLWLSTLLPLSLVRVLRRRKQQLAATRLPGRPFRPVTERVGTRPVPTPTVGTEASQAH
jgi:glycosyltransferase involved in cell wall biosynthesis